MFYITSHDILECMLCFQCSQNMNNPDMKLLPKSVFSLTIQISVDISEIIVKTDFVPWCINHFDRRSRRHCSDVQATWYYIISEFTTSQLEENQEKINRLSAVLKIGFGSTTKSSELVSLNLDDPAYIINLYMKHFAIMFNEQVLADTWV